MYQRYCSAAPAALARAIWLQPNAGHRLSVQYHEEKDETSYLFSGRLLLSTGKDPDQLDVAEIASGTAWRNEPGALHTIEALEDSVVVEDQRPSLTMLFAFPTAMAGPPPIRGRDSVATRRPIGVDLSGGPDV